MSILSGGEKVFREAAQSFLQIRAAASTAHHLLAHRALAELAEKRGSSALLQVAVLMKEEGPFDKVMTRIDGMIALLRKEEQDDVNHRDSCEKSVHGNEVERQNLQEGIERVSKELDRFGNGADGLKAALAQQKAKIVETRADMKKMQTLREEEHVEFQRAADVDAQAADLVKQAAEKLSKYYKVNSLSMGMVQEAPAPVWDVGAPAPAPLEAPKQEVTPKASNRMDAPEFRGGASHQGESKSIIAILDMMEQDFRKDIEDSKAARKVSMRRWKRKSVWRKNFRPWMKKLPRRQDRRSRLKTIVLQLWR
jgi:hypothetical protein